MSDSKEQPACVCVDAKCGAKLCVSKAVEYGKQKNLLPNGDIQPQPASHGAGEVEKQLDRYIDRYLQECDSHMETKGALVEALNKLDAALSRPKVSEDEVRKALQQYCEENPATPISYMHSQEIYRALTKAGLINGGKGD